MSRLSIGSKIPSFKVVATGDQTISSQTLKNRPFVLYFYPRDNTPGCTTEGRDFAASYAHFRQAGVSVFGVSQDSLASHEKFVAKLSLPFPLLSDEKGDLCRAFEVMRLKKMYGKEFEGIERSTFLVDAKGVLVQEWRKVKVPGHVASVLQAIAELPD